jgi:DNA helicase HerA-like ATPase
MMMFDRSLLANGRIDVESARAVKTVPVHFSAVHLADDEDFQRVFGVEDSDHPNHFEIGRPLDMEVPVCLDLKQFVERSNGVFGKSGTGKSFLTRLLLAGVVRSKAAVNLIFDMHSEYGWSSQSEIDVEDIVLLQDELKLNPTAVEHSHLLMDRYKGRWISSLLDMDTDAIKDFCAEHGGNQNAMAGRDSAAGLRGCARRGFGRR